MNLIIYELKTNHNTYFSYYLIFHFKINTMKKILFISSLILTFAFIGCSSSSDDDDGINVPPGDDPAALQAAQNYYNSNLKDFIVTNCVSCHENQHNQSNSSNYGSFTNARNAASSMFNQVNSGAMPKGGPMLQQADIDRFEEFRDLVNAIN